MTTYSGSARSLTGIRAQMNSRLTALNSKNTAASCIPTTTKIPIAIKTASLPIKKRRRKRRRTIIDKAGTGLTGIFRRSNIDRLNNRSVILGSQIATL